MLRTPCLLAAALAVASPELTAQIRLFRLDGATTGDAFGAAFANAGDVDRDGARDFAIGVPHGGAGATGLVQVRASFDARVLRTLTGGAAGDGFGAALATLGDLDGDGVPELAIGAPQTGNDGPGYVRIVSGRTGVLLRQISGRAAGDQFGGALATVGDVDADGRLDLLVGASQRGTPGAGYARVVSAATGAVLLTLDAGATPAWGFGAALAADGLTAVVGAPDLGAGAVFGFALRPLAPLFVVAGGAAGEQAGSALARTRDANGDGRADFVVGAPGGDRARVLSGVTGTTIATLQGTLHSRFGAAVAGGFDLDADGVGDVAVGAPQDGSAAPGHVTLWSVRTGRVLQWYEGATSGGRFGAALAAIDSVTAPSGQSLLFGALPATQPGACELRTTGGDGVVLGRSCGCLDGFPWSFLRSQLTVGGGAYGDVPDGYGVALLIVSPPPALPRALGGTCQLWLEPAALIPQVPFPYLGPATISLRFPLPGDAQLLGLQLALQVATLCGPALQTLGLSGGMYTVVVR